ncbi:monocarboxylate transporter 12-B-like [Patiria miniata]|uniref:Major facilitator superfamily (MFS) profile domain-containing protein n=1 Tax=Patiria miniata TaxID=46514 RepID=A0A913ZI53_PATMI|nr:monocarboxylate transporter 12-B-like [Patiria miniata]
MATSPSHREGGWGWAVVLACFVTEFIAFGNLKALAILITSMKEDFGTELWVVGSIVSLHYAVQYIMSPLAAALARKLGIRSLILVGGTLYGVGLVVSALTPSVAIFAISLAVVSGTGIACTLDLIHAEVTFYFQEKYALAVFISSSGSPVGMMLYGPITQVLMDTYGWRGAMLLLGGFSFHLVLGGMLVRRPTASYQEVPDHEEHHTIDGKNSPGISTDEAKPTKRVVSNPLNSVFSALCLEVFFSADFMILAAKRMLYSIAFGGSVIYIVPNGLALGLTTSEVAFLTTAWGVGDLAGMLLSAWTFHIKVLSVQNVEVLAVIVSVLGLLLQPFVASFVGQTVLVLIVGVGMGCTVQGILVMTRWLPFGDDKFVIVFGWQTFLSGAAASIGDTLSGWLSDATGSFHATFFLYSATMAAILLCLLQDVIRIISPPESSKQRGLMVLMPSLFKRDSSMIFERMPIQPNTNSAQ